MEQASIDLLLGLIGAIYILSFSYYYVYIRNK